MWRKRGVLGDKLVGEQGLPRVRYVSAVFPLFIAPAAGRPTPGALLRPQPTCSPQNSFLPSWLLVFLGFFVCLFVSSYFCGNFI